jgi:hypothetical protein
VDGEDGSDEEEEQGVVLDGDDHGVEGLATIPSLVGGGREMPRDGSCRSSKKKRKIMWESRTIVGRVDHDQDGVERR